ncbi:MAG: DUF2586 domain-containing protein [Desulfotalea sp.]
MAVGTIQLNKLNLLQGRLPDIERHFLYIGLGATNVGKVLSIGPETDLDVALGETETLLKTQVKAASLNAGQNFTASVMPVADKAQWSEAVDFAMEVTSVEGIELVEPIEANTELEVMQAKTIELMAKFMRPVFFIATVRSIITEGEDAETWADYLTAIDPLLDNVAADQVCVVPYLWPIAAGALAGRLCNRAVTVADTPMRVATGPMIGEWAERPVDKDGAMLTMAHIKALDKKRFSVPQWYPDFPGTYWADCNMLDVPGGDYQVVEHLRVIQKAMRKIYPLIVARIGDRRLNSTPVSEAENKNYFLRPLRKMSKSTKIMGLTFPGEIYPPTDESIAIKWMDKETVIVSLTGRPYNCPKDITVNLALDLTTE